jgi:hypothetical protein
MVMEGIVHKLERALSTRLLTGHMTSAFAPQSRAYRASVVASAAAERVSLAALPSAIAA